jgi:hypothetical protein
MFRSRIVLTNLSLCLPDIEKDLSVCSVERKREYVWAIGLISILLIKSAAERIAAKYERQGICITKNFFGYFLKRKSRHFAANSCAECKFHALSVRLECLHQNVLEPKEPLRGVLRMLGKNFVDESDRDLGGLALQPYLPLRDAGNPFASESASMRAFSKLHEILLVRNSDAFV